MTTRTVIDPPTLPLLADGAKLGGWWHHDGDRVVCDLCPRECSLQPGDRGFCFVRENRDGQMVLSTYGRSTGFCVDPIEKKPLNHFYPGTAVLSFGTAGCNLGCKFCQNWDISKSREVERLSSQAGPESIAEAAVQSGCRSVAFTYNDPIIWAEYAMDVAAACHERDIKTVAVTAGYISPQAREPFFGCIDAANVDLKSFSEDFYHRITYSHLQPILDTLIWLRHESEVWFEITNLVIPEANDSEDELREMCDWIVKHLGPDVPVHFSAFHPDFRMQDRPRTPHETLIRAHDLATQSGLQFVYVGNVDDVRRHSTYCPNCQQLLIERNWYELGGYSLNRNRCSKCDASIAGHFDTRPGTWGRKRLPIQIQNHPSDIHSTQPSGKQTPMANASTVATSPELTAEQEAAILDAAQQILTQRTLGQPTDLADPTLANAADTLVMGTFVTVKRSGNLRGCCGAVGQVVPIREALIHAAERTATEDARFPALTLAELPYLTVDVTLLYAFEPITASGDARADAIEIGRHGLTIRKGTNSGLLLPSVAVEHDLNPHSFLRQLCRKAGLPAMAWKDEDTELQTFEGHMIEGDMKSADLPELKRRPLLSQDELDRLGQHCRANIMALAAGATPNYYVPGGCWDGQVQGICLSVTIGEQTGQWTRFSMRPGMPLQSSLTTMTESVVNTLGQAAAQATDVRVVVLTRPTMHGSVQEPDLRGFDPAHQALLVTEGQRAVLAFDPEKSAEETLELVRDEANVAVPTVAGVFGLNCYSTTSPLLFTNAPRPQLGKKTRPSAVAGTFYPADMNELWTMVDGFMSKRKKKQDVPAIMVPHAGLRFSGGVAGQVFEKVTVPDQVIVIGPKHTRHGVRFAVAAHEAWQMPWGEVPGDPELAQLLVERVPHLQMDDAAHYQEHSVEVELPFIARANPNAKVVGIVIGNGGLKQCQEIAEGLAGVLQELNPRPLLVISSDMNHYASDDENRRLDEIAMKALETVNPETIYEEVTNHQISMCGVLPAVTVMETLKQLDQVTSASRIAYATSADVTGETARVVGYAGMTFS